MDKNNSYVFLGDIIETDEDLPLQLFDNFYLRKATIEQRKKIKSVIEHYFQLTFIRINKYEHDMVSEGKTSYSFPRLKTKDWKYYVIEHSETMAQQTLEPLFSLCSLDLTILFEAAHMGMRTTGGDDVPGIMSHSLRAINYFHDTGSPIVFSYSTPFPQPKKITKESLDELRYINELLKKFDEKKFPLIKKSLNDLVAIKDLSGQTPFKILSCFSILELLLTAYKPRGGNDNSISTQLKKKLNLLNNQLKEKINIKNYFEESETNSFETIIEKLYQYRNDIAHGNLSNFEKELKIFQKQQKNIFPFLNEVLKKMLLKALEQPQLISDLKEC